MTVEQTHRGLDAVDWKLYDFIDLGASSGGSLRTCARRFGARRGLGIDISPSKVQRARDEGLAVLCADARDLRVSDVVRFVSAVDFFEHLPSLDVVREVLAAAARAASDFIYISHPSFEGEHYLRSLGLTQYWHGWSGHTAHVRVSDYCQMFEQLGLCSYTIRYDGRIVDSNHPSILPLGLPKNQHRYDAALHGPRPKVEFDEPVWRVQRIYVALRPIPPEEWEKIVT